MDYGDYDYTWIGEVDKDGRPNGFGKKERIGRHTTIGFHEGDGLFTKGHLIRFLPWGEILTGEHEYSDGSLYGHVIRMTVTDEGVTPEFWVYSYGHPMNKVGQVLSEDDFLEGAKSLRPRIKKGMGKDVKD